MVDDLIVQMEARLVTLRQQVAAVEAAIAALRGLPAPVTVPALRITGVGDPAPADNTTWSKMPRHLCDGCHQRTTWDPCEHCGHAAPVIATLAGIAPLPGHPSEEDD